MYVVGISRLDFEDGEHVLCYGVLTKEHVPIPNICMNRDELEAFVEKLNLYGAPEIYVGELIEDFLLGR